MLNPTADCSQKAASPPRLALITCAVMETEVEHLLPHCPNVVAYRKIEQGLHNEPSRLRERLKVVVEEVERDTDATAIALVYGLCSRGVEGFSTRRCRLAIARAHDCITLLLGSRETYARYVAEHPGTYWYSPGWNRHHLPPGPERYHALRQQYVENYGEDNADYLMSQEQHWFGTYTRATYVHLTVGATSEDRQFTQGCADWLKWKYDEQQGDMNLLRRLLVGDWDGDDFLVLEPGQAIQMSGDAGVIRAVAHEDAERE